MGLFASAWAERKAGAVGYPAVGWSPIFGQRAASSGMVVTDDKANTISAWWAGVRRISSDVATLPLDVYRMSGRNRVPADDLPQAAMLKRSPNPEMTSLTLRETLMGHLLTWGNAYCERELDGLGRTVRLWPLRPDRMKVTVNEAGQRTYEYRIGLSSAPTVLPASKVWHIPGLGFDGIIGYAPLTLARESLADIIGLREYGSRVLDNDARPGVILSHPHTLTDTARKNIEDSWNDNHGGFTNAGRTAVLEEGISVTTLGMPRQDMLFLEARKWQVTDVARWLGIAPHKIGDLERATFSNIEEQNLDHAAFPIQPWCTKWEQQIDMDLLPPGAFSKHNLNAILRGKTLERYQAWAIATQNKAMVPNEWRAFEDWNPVSWGDEPVLTPNNSAEEGATT